MSNRRRWNSERVRRWNDEGLPRAGSRNARISTVMSPATRHRCGCLTSDAPTLPRPSAKSASGYERQKLPMLAVRSPQSVPRPLPHNVQPAYPDIAERDSSRLSSAHGSTGFRAEESARSLAGYRSHLLYSFFGGPMEQGCIHHDWTRACNRAGVPRYRIHDLRHSVASNLIAGGMGLLEVVHLPGHQNARRVTQVYGHLLRRTTTNRPQR